jgi:hypothetical protein
LAVVRSRDPDRAAEAMLEHIVQSATTYDTGTVANEPRPTGHNREEKPHVQSKLRTR